VQKWLHSERMRFERVELLATFGKGKFESRGFGKTCCAKGLDLPEVSLGRILDADKEGFCRQRDVAIAKRRTGGCK